ncbi:hypothetical protein EI94DRAFT_1814611 [Lactarius quietus]|nr:hypothetical protein EI94DRAFT_1814611 [Lactarius quietus]
MSQSPAVGSSSKSHIPTTSSSNFNVIFDKALKEYKKKTKQKLTAHPLAALLDKCDSPAAILAILQDQVDQFNEDRSSDERLQRWLVPTINVLQAFSETLGEGISLVFSPAKVIFVGAGVLLQTAKEVEESQDIIVDIFERIENFFRRLEVYTKVPPTPAMTNMMVKIMVEVLDILGTATKEMKQSRAKKFIMKIAGITRLEDGLKKLDKMTNEEARMANAEVMRLAYDIDKKVDGVDENVKGVGAQVKGVDEKVQGVYEKVHGVNETVREIHENVQGVDMKVEGVGEDVKAVEEKVQMVIDDGKQAAMEAQVIMQRTAYNVDGVQRRQLLQSLRNWQSPSDPSMNHNFASDRHHGGTAEWFCRGRNFDEWKVSVLDFSPRRPSEQA